MTGIIAIDESGDLGARGARYFVIAAVIARRGRDLMKAHKAVPTGSRGEIKFYNAKRKERVSVLKEISNADVRIVYACVDKLDPAGPQERGNALYRLLLENLMENALLNTYAKDVNIEVDESSFISSPDFGGLSKELSEKTNRNLKKCTKISSKCVKIADYVAGAIRTMHESGETEYYDIISEKCIRCL